MRCASFLLGQSWRMANEPQTPAPAAPPAPVAPSTPSTAPAPRTPSTAAPGARQDAFTAADRQRRLDSGPRRIGEAPRDAAPAPDRPAAKPGQASSFYPYADPPAEPEKIKLAEGFEFTPDELTELRAHAQQEATRKLTLPTDPSGYKLDLPPSFKMPDGIEFELNDRDPLLAGYRALAHKRGLDQETFSEGLGLVAAMRGHEAAQMKAAYEAEVEKLGAAAPDRVDSVVRWIDAIAGDDAAALKNALRIAPVAGTIVAFEKIIKYFVSQGLSPFSSAHRADAPDDGKIPGFDTMTFEQKRLAQDQYALRKQRGGR